MVCIYREAAPGKRIFSQVALSFVLIYAGLTVSDFFLQWTVVLPSITSNETAQLSLLSIYNPHGIPVAIESLGYLLLDAALLFLAPVFRGRNSLSLLQKTEVVAEGAGYYGTDALAAGTLSEVAAAASTISLTWSVGQYLINANNAYNEYVSSFKTGSNDQSTGGNGGGRMTVC